MADNTPKLTYDETQFLHQVLHNLLALRGSLYVGLRPSRLLSVANTHMQTAELYIGEELRQMGTEVQPVYPPEPGDPDYVEPSVAADAADPST